MDLKCLLVFFAILALSHADAKPRKNRRQRVRTPASLKTSGCPNTTFSECRCRKNRYGLSADCANKGISTIPQTFSDLTINVDLSMNNISSIDEKSFNNLHLMERLQLSSNQISEIHPSSFNGLHSLTVLMLHDNRLTTIPPRLFAGAPNIRHLKLDANYIDVLTADSFIGLHNLQHLYLDDNLLTSVPTSAFRNSPNIQVLSMTVNKVTSIPDGAFEPLHNLRVLRLRENKITQIGSRGMDGITRCRILDLTFNELTEYPKTVTGLTELTELLINDNSIRSLPDRAFSRQRNLELLTFHNNPLTSVGRWTFTNLNLVTSLSIMGVSQQEYFPDFSGCDSLEELTVTGGKIYSLPRDLCGGQTSLKSLNVADNRLFNLSGISNCYMLETLDASGNSFTSLHSEETKNLTNLSELNLSNNDISSLDEDVFEKMDLAKLNLAENPFSLLPVRGLRFLRTLNLSGVRNLLYLPPMQLFSGLRHLDATYAYHCCQVSKEWSKAQGTRRPSVSCYPEPGPLSPCSDLLPSAIVRVVLWLVLVASCILNLSILCRSFARKCISVCRQSALRQKSDVAPPNEESHENESSAKKYAPPASPSGSRSSNSGAFEVALSHLALADLIASVYVGIIVSYDASSRGDFAESGAWWQQSSSCRAAGFFLVMGLQLSFFTVLIATLERYLSTMFPLKPEKHFGTAVMNLTLSAAWVISVATAVVTLYSGTDRTTHAHDNPLPSYNGATCLPWSTDFPYVAVLVGGHVIACLVVIILCVLMYCARRKQSWLSAQKHTRRQIALIVACNIVLILPLALIGLLASAVATYPAATQPWFIQQSSVTDYFNYNTTKLNVDLILMFVMLLISLRFMLNPILYIAFSQSFRCDFKKLASKMFCAKRRSRYHDYDSDGDDNGTSEMASEFAYRGGNVDLPMRQFAVLQEDDHLIPGVLDDEDPGDGVYHRRLFYPHGVGAEMQNRYLYDDEIQFGGEYDVLRHPRVLGDDVATTSQWDGVHRPHVTAYPVFRANQFHPSANHAKQHDEEMRNRKIHPKSLLIQSRIPSPSDYEPDSDEPGPSRPDTSLYTAQRARPRYWNAGEAKGRLPPLTWQKFRQENQSHEGPKLLQSCESSTSKDSGIQSEPDFGVGAACSSGCSTMSRSSAGKCNIADHSVLIRALPCDKATLERHFPFNHRQRFYEPALLETRQQRLSSDRPKTVPPSSPHANLQDGGRIGTKTETVL